MKRYVLTVEGGVEPFLDGPFKTEKARFKRAKETHDESDELAVFVLDIDAKGKPMVYAFLAGAFDGG